MRAFGSVLPIVGKATLKGIAMSRRSGLLESLESRTHLTFTQLDPSFGTNGSGGMLTIEHNASSDRPIAAYLTPLNDGRLIRVNSDHIHYLRGDGTPDVKRGESGVRRLRRQTDSSVASAVDPATGRVAVIRLSSVSQHYSLVLFDAKGRMTAERDLGDSMVGEPREVAFAPDGGAMVLTDKPGVWGVVILRRYDAQLNPVMSFHQNGRYEYQYGAQNDDIWNRGAFDAAGRFYLVTNTRHYSDSTPLDSTQTLAVRRFTTAGALDSTYGVNGVATLAQGSERFEGDSSSVQLRDIEIATDGTATALVHSDYDTRGKARTRALRVARLDSGGKNLASRTLTERNGYATLEGSLTAGGGFVYVSVLDQSRVTHLYKLTNDTKLSDAPNWSTWGSYANAISQRLWQSERQRRRPGSGVPQLDGHSRRGEGHGRHVHQRSARNRSTRG